MASSDQTIIFREAKSNTLFVTACWDHTLYMLPGTNNCSAVSFLCKINRTRDKDQR